MINNILITSAGRRVSLVRNFQDSLKKFNKIGKVYTTDMNPFFSSACQVSDGFLEVPRVTDSDYLNILKDYCMEKKISIVIPTIDTELHILAEVKEEFWTNGIFIAISSKEMCKQFYLKDRTEKFFLENGFNTPRSIQDIKTCDYPIFAKLNNSSCSIGAQIVYTPEAAKELAQDENYVFQEFIKGNEFTVDVFIDKYQNIISIVPRQRLEVRSGEVSKAETVKSKRIIKEIKNLCKVLKNVYGAITIQLFKTENRIVFIEINPRFGGGYPLSPLSGANFAKYLIEDYLDIPLEYDEKWINGNIMLRYDAEVIINNKKENRIENKII